MEKKQKTEMNQKEYGHFPNLTDKTSQEKEKKKKRLCLACKGDL